MHRELTSVQHKVVKYVFLENVDSDIERLTALPDQRIRMDLKAQDLVRECKDEQSDDVEHRKHAGGDAMRCTVKMVEVYEQRYAWQFRCYFIV